MPARKDEAVASHPFGVARIMSQVAGPHGKCHCGGTHGQAGMARIGLLNAIRREETECVDGAELKIICHVCNLFVEMHPFYHPNGAL